MAKRSLQILGEAMNLVCSIYGGTLQDLDDLDEPGAGEELAALANILLCDNSYVIKCQSKPENSSYGVFWSNGMSQFGDLTEKLMTPGGHGHVF